MFLDTSGGSGGPWQDEGPAKPKRRVSTVNKNLVWLLVLLVITIFLGAFAFAAYVRGFDGQRDAWLLLMSIPVTAALSIFARITFEWHMREVPRRNK